MRSSTPSFASSRRKTRSTFPSSGICSFSPSSCRFSKTPPVHSSFSSGVYCCCSSSAAPTAPSFCSPAAVPQHELAVRSAIGASRWRIVRQLLVEATVISVTGAILGVAASYWLAKLPMQLSPSSFPQESVIRINLPILAFSVALALLSGLLFGLVPALRLSRPDLARALPSRQQGISAAPAKHRWSALIAAQIALTLLLMATAGTAIRSFLHLTELPLGYNPNQVMQVGIVLHFRNLKEWDSIRSREARTAYVEEIRQKIAAVPGVRSVAVGINAAPPYTGAEESAVDISGIPRGENQPVRIHSVSP